MLIWYVVMAAFTGMLAWPSIENRLTIRKERRDRQRLKRF